MLPLTIDRQRTTPLSEQVSAQLRRLIAAGHLPPGARLPSSRRLAAALGVSRNTVVQAFERLLDGGWLEAGVGRGTFVARRLPSAGLASPPPGGAFPWHDAIVQDCPPPVTRRDGIVAGDGPPEPGMIDFAGAVPSADSYPASALRLILDRVLRRVGAPALGYGPPAGYRPLRAWIAERAGRRGRPARPEDVLIVGGSQQGIDLLGRLLLAPGDAVVVESPTYSNALQLWRLHGARVRGVPLDDGGVRPDLLAAALERERPKLVYVMPTFQNPTGASMDGARRRAVMEVLRRHPVPVIEDDFDAELRFDGDGEPSLAAFDDAGQVVQLGTFSKILCPGFRLGWIIAPPALRQRLLDVKRIADLSTSLPAQMAIAELCISGELDRHLERVRRQHAARLRAMLEAIDAELPGTVEVTRPRGGMTLWLTLPAGVRAVELMELLRLRGVAVAPGDWFFPDGEVHGEHLRLSFVGESVERIRRGIAVLGEELRRYHQRPPRRPRLEEAVPFV
ncbi:MAG: PLP-dependent aminotransferase family protein [Acidobacteria bacterium]|nr:MAG: PLP-dependent aminotransferase family protein [Acidobacteriota bacterium]